MNKYSICYKKVDCSKESREGLATSEKYNQFGARTFQINSALKIPKLSKEPVNFLIKKYMVNNHNK